MVSSSEILNARVLIVDDLDANVRLLERMLQSAGYASIASTMDPHEVCELHRINRYDLILLDLMMPGMDGFQVMEDLKEIEPDGYFPVLVITAQPAHKLRALEAGAKDFISKPFDLIELQTRIHNLLEVRLLYKRIENYNTALEQSVEERTLELRTALSEIKTMKDQLETENIFFRHENKMKHLFENIIGQSDGLKYVLYRAEQVAPANTTVLILGETGTGKELIAAAIHNMSPRKERPLITVNCAALPGNLIESELFGREKGAFTGADSRQVGRFEVANGSTLCLDEIGELPLELQAKLLRVIQHNEFERLGSSHTIKVDVRIVATTNRDLEEEIRKGRFRQDLYYRLNVFPITVPPLRQRKDDIPLMVQAFIERYSRKLGRHITSIQKETMKVLQEYPWPGNVRELESIIERAMILCPGPVFQLTDRLDIPSQHLSSTVRTLEETERNQILKILSETRWHIEGKEGAAAILGLNSSTLRARMHKLGIVRPEIKKPN
jgi:DNA-binding NtrC family response regulator